MTSLCFAILGGPFSFELSNVLLDLFLHPCLQLPTIAKEEQDLEPDEERGQEEGLHEVVEKSRGTSLKLSMADELKYPSQDKDAAGNDGGIPGIHGVEVVICSGHGDANGA